MRDFIEKHSLLYSSQYGFRQAHSTQHAILDMVETIQTNMDKKLFSCGVFIDLKKAFDTVNHTILLDKLNYYSFRGTVNQWFSSYLSNRTQSTEIGSHISSKLNINCGVPQGSLLGLCNVTLPNSKWRQYLHSLFIPVERRLTAA